MADLQQFANNASTILAGSSLTDSNPSSEFAITAAMGVPFHIYVAEGTGDLFPSQAVLGNGNFFLVTIEDVVTRNFEIFRCTARDGDKITISLRGDEGTTRNNFPNGSKVELRWTRDSIERLRQYSRDVAEGYTHVQASTSQSWVVVHNRNKLVETEIWIDDGSGGFLNVGAEVRYVDDNSILIEFSEAVSGKALIR